MIIYAVNAGDGEPAAHVPTKREAIKLAKDQAGPDGCCPPGESVTVERIDTGTIDRAVLCRLANCEGGFVESATIVASFPSQRERTA